jgi:spore germination cell wall hydrolase CwlJ-like protein
MDTAGTVGALSDRDVLALTLWAEGRSETLDGRAAIGCVVRNRAASRRQSAREVCLAPMQFSCWQPKDGKANHDALMLLAESVADGKDARDPVLRECQWIADGILSGSCRDLTHGADHYVTTALLSSTKKPGWIRTMTFTVRIGAHAFYRS